MTFPAPPNRRFGRDGELRVGLGPIRLLSLSSGSCMVILFRQRQVLAASLVRLGRPFSSLSRFSTTRSLVCLVFLARSSPNSSTRPSGASRQRMTVNPHLLLSSLCLRASVPLC